MLGGATLWQLRQALTAAESEVEGGLSPRLAFRRSARRGGPAAARGLRPAGGRQRDHRGRVRQCALPDARPRRHGREQPGGRAPARPGAAGHAPARGGDLRRALRPAERPRRGELRGAFPARLGAARVPAQAAPPGSAAQRLADALGTAEQAPAKKRGEARSCDCRSAKCCRRASASSPTPAVLPPRHHSLDHVDRHPHRRRAGLDRSPAGAMVEKAVDVVPTTMFMVAWQRLVLLGPHRIDGCRASAGRRARRPGSGICSRWPA